MDIAYEEDAGPGLLEAMAGRHVLVEINLTSNCVILVVCGRDHPFPLYRRAGVPVALSTDDEGIERTDLTAEYQRAVVDFGLEYEDLKTLARAALHHGFLPGGSLWRAPDDFIPVAACAADRLGDPHPSQTCQQWLEDNQRAHLEWRQEAAFASFERRHGG